MIALITGLLLAGIFFGIAMMISAGIYAIEEKFEGNPLSDAFHFFLFGLILSTGCLFLGDHYRIDCHLSNALKNKSQEINSPCNN